MLLEVMRVSILAGVRKAVRTRFVVSFSTGKTCLKSLVFVYFLNRRTEDDKKKINHTNVFPSSFVNRQKRKQNVTVCSIINMLGKKTGTGKRNGVAFLFVTNDKGKRETVYFSFLLVQTENGKEKKEHVLLFLVGILER